MCPGGHRRRLGVAGCDEDAHYAPRGGTSAGREGQRVGTRRLLGLGLVGQILRFLDLVAYCLHEVEGVIPVVPRLLLHEVDQLLGFGLGGVQDVQQLLADGDIDHRRLAFRDLLPHAGDGELARLERPDELLLLAADVGDVDQVVLVRLGARAGRRLGGGDGITGAAGDGDALDQRSAPLRLVNVATRVGVEVVERDVELGDDVGEVVLDTCLDRVVALRDIRTVDGHSGHLLPLRRAWCRTLVGFGWALPCSSGWNTSSKRATAGGLSRGCCACSRDFI